MSSAQKASKDNDAHNSEEQYSYLVFCIVWVVMDKPFSQRFGKHYH